MNLESSDAPLTPSLSPSEGERVPEGRVKRFKGSKRELVPGILSSLRREGDAVRVAGGSKTSCRVRAPLGFDELRASQTRPKERGRSRPPRLADVTVRARASTRSARTHLRIEHCERTRKGVAGQRKAASTTPSPLNGERAGVRGETVRKAPPFPDGPAALCRPSLRLVRLPSELRTTMLR
jgi:hypothetical protein